MRDLWLGAAAFALTLAETAVSTFEGRADRRATTARDNSWSLKAAHWAAIFEAILLLDILILVRSLWISVPIVAGAWVGKYWATERRRRKFRRRPRKPTTSE